MKQINPEISQKIDLIDLTNARKRLMDPKLGKGWSAEKTDTIIKKYRNFLRLLTVPGVIAVPTKEVDEVWHTHILDTRSYANDCQRVFGRFIHHMPYMETSALDTSWKDTCKNYKKMFGEDYSENK